MFLKTSLFDQPVSDIIPTAPGGFPSNRSGLILLPLKTKNGGMAEPVAFPLEMTVVKLVMGLQPTGVYWLFLQLF